ncbi:hypothetical protein [Hymenobacter crusticola]|uniref:Uncharacterized protein n=1 Tax=Hymenobacter crusticola TaxID=1770526 RepID=A0A243W852_9BACT|nr:hypothetical protein [Hymenobacter crusticola]OUJ69072.1 hypothetical protein BXP70_27045 [Hymenobacter crusticola]
MSEDDELPDLLGGLGQDEPSRPSDDATSKGPGQEADEEKRRLDEERRARILRDADRSRSLNPELDFGIGEESEDLDSLPQIQDEQKPDTSHKLYYSLRRILMDNLPSGSKNKEARQMVYDQKNLFLNRGKDKDGRGIRGSDGRQAYIHYLEVALATAQQWVREGANTYDIYVYFEKLNKKYHSGDLGEDEGPEVEVEPLV